MENRLSLNARQEKISLNQLLFNRSTLYSENRHCRNNLVQRTLQAAAAGVELRPDLTVKEGLYRIMDDIAQSDSSSRIAIVGRKRRCVELNTTRRS